MPDTAKPVSDPLSARAINASKPAQLAADVAALPRQPKGMGYGAWFKSLTPEQKVVVRRDREWARDYVRKTDRDLRSEGRVTDVSAGRTRKPATGTNFNPDELLSKPNDYVASLIGKLERGVMNRGYKAAPFLTFLRSATENLAPRNTFSRAKQIVTHGVTDSMSGLADLVGWRRGGNWVRARQANVDNWLDSQMSDHMRGEYQDDKFGRAAGEVASTAIGMLLPMPKGGKLLSKIPGASKLMSVVSKVPGAKTVGGALNRLAHNKATHKAAPVIRYLSDKYNARTAKLVNTAGRFVRRVPGGGMAGRLISRAMMRVKPDSMSNINSMLNLVANIRGRDLATRRDSGYAGDVNLVMRLKDSINEIARRARARGGDDLAQAENLPMMAKFVDRYRRGGGSPVVLSRLGKPIYMTGPTGDFIRDENGGLIPIYAESADIAKVLERAMSDTNAYGASKVGGSFSTSIIGKLLNREQPRFSKTPGFIVDPSSGAIVGFSPRLKKNEEGGFLMERPVSGRLGAAYGGAAEFLGYVNPWTSPFMLGADIHDAIQTGDIGGGVGLASALLSSKIPGLKQLYRWGRKPVSGIHRKAGKWLADNGTRYFGIPKLIDSAYSALQSKFPSLPAPGDYGNSLLDNEATRRFAVSEGLVGDDMATRFGSIPDKDLARRMTSDEDLLKYILSLGGATFRTSD